MKALVAILTLAIVLLASCGQGSTKVTATMEEWKIQLSQTTVPAGDVTFSVQNKGKEEHELVLLKTDLAPDKLTPRKTDPAKAEEPGSIGEIEDIAAGTTKDATFRLTPGNYVLICNYAAHYANGMWIALTVR